MTCTAEQTTPQEDADIDAYEAGNLRSIPKNERQTLAVIDTRDYEGFWPITDCAGSYVGRILSFDTAQEIVKAVNAHESLVAALKEAREWIDEESDRRGDEDGSYGYPAYTAVERLDAVLKLAGAA